MTAHTRLRASTRLASQQNSEANEEKPAKRIKTERRSTASSVSSTNSIASTTNTRSHRDHHSHYNSTNNDTNDENNANSTNSNNSTKNGNQKKGNITKNNATTTPDALTYMNAERVLCYHGYLIYEAKILKGEIWENKSIAEENGPHYLVHYKGWKQTWDEWVPESRVLKYNEVNLKRQSELKASVAAQKHSKYHEKKIADTGTDRGRKRSKDVGKEEEFIKKPEIKIVIPDLLKLQLVDDWENITKDQKLVSLPRKPNVAEILDDYKKLKVNTDSKDASNDVILEMLNGIKQYFDKALGNILLYHFERQQYVQAIKDYPDKEMSSIYGAEHLLRLFVQFPQLLAYTNMDQDSMTLLKDQFSAFLEYMANNKEKIFQIEYENASPTYISLVKDN